MHFIYVIQHDLQKRFQALLELVSKSNVLEKVSHVALTCTSVKATLSLVVHSFQMFKFDHKYYQIISVFQYWYFICQIISYELQ